ncbi:MAG: PrgI family mobile element protein [Candidatus Saccharimonadales bacterium]
MRTTTVPAQITTVEDKIAGELNLIQLLLLVAPIFGGAGIFVVLPPFFNSAPYKIVLIVCLAVVFSTLAIRIKGKILLQWILILTRYNTRPRYYVLNKNDVYLRDIPKPEAPEQVAKSVEPKKTTRPMLPRLTTAELVKVEQLIANPQSNLRFKANSKGGLDVFITEVK